jgi:hypothetical protein
MTALGIVFWGIFCTITVYGVFKQFNLPKELIWGIGLVILSFAGPVFFFWGNTSAVNVAYGVYAVIMLMSFVISCLFKRTRKMFAWFFLGVVLLFSFMWAYPGLLRGRAGSTWEAGEAMLEKHLGGPFHHSTLVPVITSIILLFHCWHPSAFKLLSNHSYAYAFVLGILIFAVTSQIPDIFIYGTPWW